MYRFPKSTLVYLREDILRQLCSFFEHHSKGGSNPRHHICQKNYATTILDPNNLRRKKNVNRDKTELATKLCECANMHKDLHNKCKFVHLLHILQKRSPKTYTICANLTNTYILCVKVAQMFT